MSDRRTKRWEKKYEFIHEFEDEKKEYVFDDMLFALKTGLVFSPREPLPKIFA